MTATDTSLPSEPLRIEPHVKRIAIVVIMGLIMSVLDTTIVNVALDDLSHDLNASLDSIQWVITGYLLSLAAVIPITGWAVRRYSARRLYLVALVVFTAGSALCALASTSNELIACRVLQGIGGGMLTPIGQIILVKAAGPRNLPKVMSFIGVPIVLAPVIGPTLGGLLLQTAGWQWIFLINVPVGIAAFALALRLLPHDAAGSTEAGRLDVLGLVLAAGGTVGLTYGLSKSASAGSLTAPSVVIPVILGLVLISLFVVHARRAAHPLLDMKLFSNPAFSAASLVTFCLGGALFGAMILMPLYFQVVRGQDALVTGLLLIPQGVGGGLGMALSGRRPDGDDRMPDPGGGDDPLHADRRCDSVRGDRCGDGRARDRDRPLDHAVDDRRLLGAAARADQRRQSHAYGPDAGGRVARHSDHRGRAPGASLPRPH